MFKQPMSLTLFLSSRQWSHSIKVLIVTLILIAQNTKFILAFKFLAEFF